jgi:hypothetical protein
LLGVTQDDILDHRRIQMIAIEDRADAGNGQIVAPYVTKETSFPMRPANRCADAIDDDGRVCIRFPHAILPDARW